MSKTFLDKLRRYIEISNFERLGFFSLSFIILLVIVYSYAKHHLLFSNLVHDEERLEAFVSKNQAFFNAKSKDSIDSYQRKVSSKRQPLLKKFNPNTTSEAGLISCGLSPRISKNIFNYCQAGGSFKVKKDLIKLYSVDDNEFERIKEYIDLPDTINFKSVKQLQPRTIEVVKLNRCSAKTLMDFRGIGKVLSKRIVSFRDKLGGFYSIKQLEEVYGLSAETIEEVRPNLILDSSQIKKLSLNKASINELSAHPYLNYKQAHAIVQFRRQHGDFSTLEDLHQLQIFDDENIRRIIPYLKLN